MKLLKITTLALLVLLFGCNHHKVANQEEENKTMINLEATNIRAKEALEFCQYQNFNADFCILIDMSIHSGLKRMMIWNFKQNKIDQAFLVSHGCGNSSWSLDFTKENPYFSNKEDSHCTALGKYKIGARGYSNWGVHIKYIMHGLEDSNSNAFKRNIVFHSWEEVSNVDTYPEGTPEGWGCPAISNKSFISIDHKLQTSPLPVLMWIYKE